MNYVNNELWRLIEAAAEYRTARQVRDWEACAKLRSAMLERITELRSDSEWEQKAELEKLPGVE